MYKYVVIVVNILLRVSLFVCPFNCASTFIMITLSIMTFSTTTLSITIKNATLSIIALDTAKLCVNYGALMLSVANKPNILSVVTPNVVTLSVVAPI